MRRKLHYVSSFFLLNCDPLRWALRWYLAVESSPAALGFDLVFNCDPLRWALRWYLAGESSPAALGFDLTF